MRTKNSIRNMVFGLGGQLFNTVLNFASKTLFINILGANYLGLSGLFTNILSMLSLAELGIGTAIVCHMYKPLATNDTEKLKSLMNLYSKAYKTIGVIVAGLGISLIPFLKYIIKDMPDVPHITMIYLLFLANSVVTYFFAYKSAIISADQKNYLITMRQQIFNFIQVLIQILVLILFTNYIIYLVVQVGCSFFVNFSISKKADKLYPFIKEKNVRELDNKSKKEIYKHISAMMTHKIGSVVVNGTDNILISSFIGVYWVGLYSNYLMLINMINGFLMQIFSAITASIGNLNAEESKNKSYDVYKKIIFVNFWICGFCSIGLLTLFNSFITLWIGDKYLLSKPIVYIIVINFYISGMRQTTISYKSTLGLFWNDRYKPIAEAAINVIASILLLKKFGLIGVLLGTLISTITTSFWVEPYILFKHGFNKNVWQYFSVYIKYALITIIGAIVTQLICSTVMDGLWINFGVKLIISIIIPNVIFIIFSFRSEEFNYFKMLIVGILNKIK